MLTILFNVTAQAAVVGKEVTYQAGDTMLKGYLAYDDAQKGPRPGVLVVHEWWGPNEYVRKRANMLAELGYAALALDMYGEGKTASHPDDAGKFSSEISKNLPLAIDRFKAAYTLLQAQPVTDDDKMAAIGYCFGGAVVLQMARQGLDLDGVVSFHGSLGTQSPAQPGQVKASVLVAHGAADPFVSDEQVAAFKQEMQAANVDYRFIAYPGAKHAFTNPAADEAGQKFNLPLAYNKHADEKSWSAMQDFFHRVFNEN
jgi:dienelactone hydrolase